VKIAVYTLTRDRCAYTAACFASLRENAGLPFDHYIVDNGSKDGTLLWLETEYKPKWVWPFDENRGISIGSNMALRAILVHEYDLILKIDNDCLVTTPGILKTFAEIYASDEAQRWALSPRVEGINRQPVRVRQHELAGHPIGVTAIIGGLFHVLPGALYREFYEAGGYPETLPRGWGQDDWVCDWLARNGYAKGYVEDVVVEHYLSTDGQFKDNESYLRRKWAELEEDRKQETTA
jgi:glycosyltransferase involved in cell wall biosynthesis